MWCAESSQKERKDGIESQETGKCLSGKRQSVDDTKTLVGKSIFTSVRRRSSDSEAYVTQREGKSCGWRHRFWPSPARHEFFLYSFLPFVDVATLCFSFLGRAAHMDVSLSSPERPSVNERVGYGCWRWPHRTSSGSDDFIRTWSSRQQTDL